MIPKPECFGHFEDTSLTFHHHWGRCKVIQVQQRSSPFVSPLQLARPDFNPYVLKLLLVRSLGWVATRRDCPLFGSKLGKTCIYILIYMHYILSTKLQCSFSGLSQKGLPSVSDVFLGYPKLSLRTESLTWNLGGITVLTPHSAMKPWLLPKIENHNTLKGIFSNRECPSRDSLLLLLLFLFLLLLLLLPN